STIQTMVPPALDHVVRTCLAKDPEERWQNAHDVKQELEWIAAGGSGPELPAPVPGRRRSRKRMAWAVAGVALLATLALAAAHLREVSPSIQPTIRFSVAPPEGVTFEGPVAISPDGRRLALVATSTGKQSIWIRTLDSLEIQPLAGTTVPSARLGIRPF